MNLQPSVIYVGPTIPIMIFQFLSTATKLNLRLLISCISAKYPELSSTSLPTSKIKKTTQQLPNKKKKNKKTPFSYHHTQPVEILLAQQPSINDGRGNVVNGGEAGLLPSEPTDVHSLDGLRHGPNDVRSVPAQRECGDNEADDKARQRDRGDLCEESDGVVDCAVLSW